MSASGLRDLRSTLLSHGKLGPDALKKLRREIGGFRDDEEQAVLHEIAQDVARGAVQLDPAIEEKMRRFVAQGPDGPGRRAWNAAKGAAIGLLGALAAAFGIYELAPSVTMYLVAHAMVTQTAPAAVLLGAGFGALWDN